MSENKFKFTARVLPNIDVIVRIYVNGGKSVDVPFDSAEEAEAFADLVNAPRGVSVNQRADVVEQGSTIVGATIGRIG